MLSRFSPSPARTAHSMVLCRRSWRSGMLPTRAARPLPPNFLRSRINRTRRRRKCHRSRLQLFVTGFRRARRDGFFDLLPIDRALRDGLLTSRIDELSELGIGHIALVHPEGVEVYLHDRLFIAPASGKRTPHGESAARNKHHAGRGRCKSSPGNPADNEDPMEELFHRQYRWIERGSGHRPFNRAGA